jgi:hypothetical protein
MLVPGHSIVDAEMKCFVMASLDKAGFTIASATAIGFSEVM